MSTLMQTQVQSILLVVLMLLQFTLSLVINAPPATETHPCRWQDKGYYCSINATRINLSARGLSGQLTLIFPSDGGQLDLELLNVSNNPGLIGVTLEMMGSPLTFVKIKHLDISGTAMAPVTGRFINIINSLRIFTLIANGTTYENPLDFDMAIDLLYRVHVQKILLIGWSLANGRLRANQASSCKNEKRFESFAVSRSRPFNFLIGGTGGAEAAMISVSKYIDLSGNGFRSVSNITFSGARIDLSDNQLTDLKGVAFHPGSICGWAITSLPTLLLARNRLVYAALDNLAAGQRDGFTGLDLSGNERLVPEEEVGVPDNSKKTSNLTRIRVSEFLDLSGLGAHASGLATLLSRFQLQKKPIQYDLSPVSNFRLSFAENWITDLASASALVSKFTSTTRRGNGSGTLVHLDLSGNRQLAHLNLSSISPNLLASLTVKRLPQLRSASVRISDKAISSVHEQLRGRSQLSTIGLLTELWSQQRVPLNMDALPSRCCLADDAELVCSFHHSFHQADRHESASSSVSCFNEEAKIESLISPELPLLFTGVILGCALLLGLMTGVAVFYVRRRYNRGRYAVYSVYAVQVKDQHQSHVSPCNGHQQQQISPKSPGGQVITLCSTVLPVEKAATAV